MTLARKTGPGLKSSGTTWFVDYGPSSAQVVAGNLLPGPSVIDTTGATDGQSLVFDGTTFVPGSGGVSPFLFRLNPTVTTQLGTPRTDSTGTATVTALADASGRPFLRFTAGTGTGTYLFPLLDGSSNPVSATGRFKISALVRPQADGTNAANACIAFNVHRTTGVTYYGVGRNGALSYPHYFWFPITSGSPEGAGGVSTWYATDGSVDFAPLDLDCYLNTTTGYCYYAITSRHSTGTGDFLQLRKTSLATAGASGDALALVIKGAAAATLDIAELTVWKDEQNWS